MHEKWYLKEIMVGTTIEKGHIPDIRCTYTKGIINLREALMIRSTSCPWAWTQSSRSTPTSPMHNLSFTSRIRWSCMVENYLVKYQKGMACENLRVHTVFREGRGSTQRGIVETYTTSFNSKYHHLESRAWLAKSRNRIYQRHYVSRKELPKWLNMKDVVG